MAIFNSLPEGNSKDAHGKFQCPLQFISIYGTAPKDPIWKKKASEDAFAKNAENALPYFVFFCWTMLDLNSYISIVCILCIICLYMIYRCVCTQRILRSMEYPKSKSPACMHHDVSWPLVVSALAQHVPFSEPRAACALATSGSLNSPDSWVLQFLD